MSKEEIGVGDLSPRKQPLTVFVASWLSTNGKPNVLSSKTKTIMIVPRMIAIRTSSGNQDSVVEMWKVDNMDTLILSVFQLARGMSSVTSEPCIAVLQRSFILQGRKEMLTLPLTHHLRGHSASLHVWIPVFCLRERLPPLLTHCLRVLLTAHV